MGPVLKEQLVLQKEKTHIQKLWYRKASLVAQMVKNPPAMHETWVLSLAWEDPLEKGMATHSSVLAWIMPWTEQTGKPQGGSQRLGHN